MLIERYQRVSFIYNILLYITSGSADASIRIWSVEATVPVRLCTNELQKDDITLAHNAVDVLLCYLI